MKLVTGIEAIQSGKPWKHRDNREWIDLKNERLGFTTADLHKEEFIIKEEPREFWLFIPSQGGDICAYTSTYKGADFSGDNWIRVREVEK
jgi:hypothetical protein